MTKLWLTCVATLLFLGAAAQQIPEYEMTNATVSDCDGIIRDSENGERTGEYDHNEDYIFRICIPGASSISLVFDSFCTERYEDYLIIYGGKDTNATRLGKWDGSISPGTVTSSDSCITLYFHSDKSVSCFGFKAEWNTVLNPLPNPRFVRPPDVSCDDRTIGVRLDQKFNCDSIADSAFWVTGRVSPGTISVTPINCDANNETDTFNITFASGLDRGGRYRLDFETVKYDACDSPWVLTATTYFNINDCPIVVELMADPDTICRGTCSQLEADVSGGDSTSYVFTWNNGISGREGPHTVCPTTTTTYTLTVSDGTSVPDSDTITIVVVDPPQAAADTTICRSNPPYALSASPSGGIWRGMGITDSVTGMFNPVFAGAGTHVIEYWSNGCADTMLITVRDINAGRPNSACPNTAPFYVFDYSPSGGVWSGPNIDSNGLFTPGDTGTFTVTYTWNGCVDTKEINVYPVDVPEYDTFCLSDPETILTFSPVGGRWSGPGITSSLLGRFNPATAGAGDHTLIYRSSGCSDTTYVHVISINARWNEVACPDEAPFQVVQGLPAGGYWKGIGITDSATGTYDPSFVYGLNRTTYNDTLWYHLNGCVDWKMMYVRPTIIYDDTVKFCIEDPRMILNWTTVRRTPGGGTWTGPGAIGSYFYPSVAGYGVHTLYYDANNCGDSIIMVVHPPVDVQGDTNFCITDPPFTMRNAENSGYFIGPGVTDTTGGIFDPVAAGVGSHRIYFYSRFGCADSLLIDVYGLPNVSITSTDPFYCVKDSVFSVGATPVGGFFYGPGISMGGFNPRMAGSGNHTIYYQYGRPTCYSTDSVVVQVIDTLKVQTISSADTICQGENIILTAIPEGGTGNYTTTWHERSVGTSVIQYPMFDTWVWSEVRDGCSDTYRDSVWVVVHPEVRGSVVTSEDKCYGEVGFADVIPSDFDPYEVRWHTSPPRTGFRINAPVATRYNFTLENLRTGCTFDSSVIIPGYDRISAYFVTSPREGYCLNPFDPVLNFINQSVGATGGWWSFGDGDTIAYDPDNNPQHYYSADTTDYTITLVIWNDGGCGDTMQVRVCIDDSVYVVVPNAFSPYKQDGLNDEFRVLTAGVKEFDILIFNRWGEHLFRSNDKDFSWDAMYQGERLPPGVYSYYIEYKGTKTTRRKLRGVILVL